MELVQLIYLHTTKLPKEEDFGLKAQLRRAAVSIPSNIAEGLTRATRKDKVHFLNIAQASLSELDTQIELCKNLKYVDYDTFCLIEEKVVEVSRILSGLTRKLKTF
jgi:four helix bundle protein